jgi:hypothetical protein
VAATRQARRITAAANPVRRSGDALAAGQGVGNALPGSEPHGLREVRRRERAPLGDLGGQAPSLLPDHRGAEVEQNILEMRRDIHPDERFDLGLHAGLFPDFPG